MISDTALDLKMSNTKIFQKSNLHQRNPFSCSTCLYIYIAAYGKTTVKVVLAAVPRVTTVKRKRKNHHHCASFICSSDNRSMKSPLHSPPHSALGQYGERRRDCWWSRFLGGGAVSRRLAPVDPGFTESRLRSAPGLCRS